MMCKITRPLVIAVMLAMNSVASASLLVNSDFESNASDWTVGGPNHLTISSAMGVLHDATSSSSLWSYNTTLLPQLMDLDLDYFVSNATASDPFVIGLHVWGSVTDPMSVPSGALQDHYGYFLAITESSASRQVLELQRKDGPDPSNLEVVASTELAIDGTMPHHLRWTDCGCGRLAIYVDDPSNVVLSIDDSRYGNNRYIGRQGTHIGIGTPGTAAGWIDNVQVEGSPVYIPEPVSLLLLMLGVGQIRRRR